MDRKTRTARSLLASIASEQIPGATLRMVCPFCDGGTSGEVSLALTITPTGAYYCCHRAQCSEAGVIGSKRGIPSAPPPSPPRPLVAALRRVRRATDPHWYSWYRDSVPDGLSPTAAGLRILESDPATCAWILHGFYGEVLGHQTRKKVGFGKECRTYKITPGPLFAYFPGLGRFLPSYETDRRILVFTEDCLSAAGVAACGVPAVALLGTYLSPSLTELVQEFEWEGAAVWLDPGAERQAQRVASSLKSALPKDVRVLYSEADPKDLPAAERRDILRNLVPRST